MGSLEGKENYIRELMNDEWLPQLEELSKIATSEPQAAYSAFTAGFKHKLTYFIRTIPHLSDILKPIDDIINKQFIPAITERQAISEEDRRLLSLPVRMGGLGIPIFSESCVIEYEISQRITNQLKEKILAQDEEYSINPQMTKEVEHEIRAERDERHKMVLEELREKMSKEQIRGNDVAQMKGASAWLTSLPLQDEGFVLNKREFFDALALRYRWHLKRLPTKCVCGKPFVMDHAMQCMRGGYVHRRHDRVRDLFATIINDVAHSTQIEPPLQPLSGELLTEGSNTDDEARLDIAARSFWQNDEMAFFDIRVFNPFAKSHINTNLESLFKQNEKIKKTAYNDRVIKIEHGSFTPVVFSSFGGSGVETSKFISRLTEKVSEKKNLERSVVASYIRTKVSFELVRSQVAMIRGSRSLKKVLIDTDEVELVNTASDIRDH